METPTQTGSAQTLSSDAALTGAIQHWEQAVRTEPENRSARRNLAILLVRASRLAESLTFFRAELTTDAEGLTWLNKTIVRAMEDRDLGLAGSLAEVLTTLRFRSRWFRSPIDGLASADIVAASETLLSISKLTHDADQFRYLRARGQLSNAFDKIIADYDATAQRLRQAGSYGQVPLQADDEERIGDVYGRVVYLPRPDRLDAALSSAWNRSLAQRYYVEHKPGVVVVDHFLSDEALAVLRQYCLEATVWTGNRYQHGRVGAFFFSGFNCPLLLQIAEEVRDQLPWILGDRHPLRHVWGFKSSARQPANSAIHADFAAVNVNFWITPESANLDEGSGGLVIYDVDAPLSWEFSTYNGRLDRIHSYLREQCARKITVPYRENRAIIFNSDLFHGSAEVRFRPGYENRRVNITMLYGDRRDDNHYPGSPPDQLHGEHVDGTQRAWRSPSLTRARRR